MSENIGIKIKQIREEKSLSIMDLASSSAIHESQLELIENGELVPSMATLIHISRALGIRLGTILDGEEQQAPVMHNEEDKRLTISLSNDNEAGRSNLDFYALAEDKKDRNMEPYMINVKYISPEADSASHHEGEEFVYVLEGEIELRYGSEHYLMKKGESIYYDSIVPHSISTLSESKKAQILAVTYTPF